MTYDFVIVGAGSAGCVLADRLTANGKYSVLLLEAGGSDMRFFIQMPLGYGKTFFDPAVNWMYRAEPDPGLGGQRDYWPRGKVLGGSSSINAMVYIRGDKRDFQEWEAAGNPGWGWDPVSAAYRAIEDYEGADPAINGKGGPLRISQLGAGKHQLCDPYIEAAKAMGLPVSCASSQARRSVWASTSAANRAMTRPRSVADIAPQRPASAVRAACTAASISAAPPRDSQANRWPVAGAMTGRGSLPAVPTMTPPIRWPYRACAACWPMAAGKRSGWSHCMAKSPGDDAAAASYLRHGSPAHS